MDESKQMQQRWLGKERGQKLRQIIRKWAGWFLVGTIAVVVVFRFGSSQSVKERATEESVVDALSIVDVKQIKASEYDELASQPEIFVMDVHIPEQDHLPNTDAFIPFDQIQNRVSDLPADKMTPILVYCRSGTMSKQASAELVGMGYRSVYDLSGGVKAYNAMKVSVELVPAKQDLGVVVYGEVAETQFTLVNNTGQTVTIGRVSTSCGCTKASVAKKKIEPNEKVAVSVVFDPAVHKDNSALGDVTRTIFIDTDHPQYSEVTADITARVVKQSS